MEMSTLGRNDAYPLENFKKGVKVWIKDPERVWVAGELVENLSFTSTLIQILVNNGTETLLHQYDTEKNGLPFLCNPDILLGKDDLTNLSYLHEPAVLNNLRYRFEVRENIYTYCGIVLVAINPYADCGHLYGEEVIAVYQGIGKQVRSLDPHIYAIAEEAYFDLCEFGKNQSVIISGESGAGKTVSAKFVMKYLTNVAAMKSNRLESHRISSSTGFVESNAKIEDRVLASNPIMEAIGNAKTVRNDNSSRFGKFIQINFSEVFSVSGAEMKTYLLEKSRVVSQSKCERNFHIFYQMCSSLQHPVLKDLNLLPADRFLYTKSGEAIRIEGVNDVKQFDETLAALKVLDISEDKQREIFRVLAGVLFLGNIVFEANGDRTCVQSSSSGFIRHVCHNLLEIDQDSLARWLTAREIRAGGEIMKKNLTTQEAKNNKDAIAKIIYVCLFQWIVEKINENLMHSQDSKIKRGQLVEAKFIGVLDIYGFETFESNSFEQFCINYANEKLQQQFNQHVFKLEQLEYDKEGISWIHIDFYDNQPCIDLIEANPGIIVYLDEQSKTGRGTDIEWLDQMSNCKMLKQSEHLQMPKIRDSSFTVKHFSSPVRYNINGFIEKNKDTANEQLLDTFSRTKFKFLKEILGHVLACSSTGARRKKTVAVQFRDSLKELIQILSSTRPHYIRCIKPNDDKESFHFEPKRAIQQLRACGVLETVRISAAGFPSRWTYENFSKRYRILYPGSKMWRDNPREFANMACLKWIHKNKFALGKTKIFFRTGQVAHMERVRHDVLSSSALKIQCAWRCFVARKRFQTMLRAVTFIQASTRAFLTYRRIKYLQMYRAAVLIQSQVRGYFIRKKYLQLCSTVIAIQSHFRSSVIRQKIIDMQRERSAIIIQKYTRSWSARRKYGNFLKKVIKVQCCVRRWLARRRFKRLKIEAKSVNHLQKLNSGLENKIISLQHKVDRLTSERNALTLKCKDTERIQLELKNLRHNISEPVKLLYARRTDLKQSLTNLKNDVLSHIKQFESTNSEKQDLLNILKEVMEKSKVSLTQKDYEINSLKTELANKNVEQQKLIGKIRIETQRAKEVERSLEQMREQLVQNATLLASQDFNRKEKRMEKMCDEKSLSSSSTGILLQQQTTINDLRHRLDEKERALSRMQFLLSSTSANKSAEKCSAITVYEIQKIQDLELLVSKYRADMQKVLEHTENSTESIATIEKVQEENERLRDESIEIRALLANHFERQIMAMHQEDSGCWSTTNSDDGSSSSVVAQSEMDERIAQERLLRNYKQLLDIASRELSERDELILSLETRLDSTDVAADASLANLNASSTPSVDQNGQVLQELVQENLSLQQKLNRKSDELTEARAHLRGYSNFADGFNNSGLDLPSEVEVIRLDSLRINGNIPHSGLLQVFNVPEFTRILILDLKPRLAKRLTPCLPAYLLLMAFRFYDSSVDDAGLTGLFNAVHAVLRETSMMSNDTDVLALWLVNSWRLLNLLRQYSNDKNWSTQNTPLQNTYCIKNFNLEPIRNQLKLRVDVFYTNLMKRTVEPLLIPKIVPAILQHESCELVCNSKDAGKRYLVDLLELLNFVHQKLKNYGADHILIGQVFHQIASWICSLALNHMIFRKELCTPDKAISIKHNVMEIQNWLAENKLAGSEMFEPLIQASHLLQIRKSEAYLDVLCSETTSLMPKQVLAILRHFTPSDGFEEDVIDEQFINKVTQKLALRNVTGTNEKDELLMRGTFLEPYNSESFLYSDFQLETLSLPTCLDFQSVSRII